MYNIVQSCAEGSHAHTSYSINGYSINVGNSTPPTLVLCFTQAQISKRRPNAHAHNMWYQVAPAKPGVS